LSHPVALARLFSSTNVSIGHVKLVEGEELSAEIVRVTVRDAKGEGGDGDAVTVGEGD